MILVPFFEIPLRDRLAKNVKSRYVQIIPRSTDKCQHFADFIKFGDFRFGVTQLCKTFVPFFMNKTLHKYIQSFVIKCLLLFLMKFHRILYIASFYGKIDFPNYKVVLK